VRFQLNLGDYGNTLFIGFPENGTSGFDYKGDADKFYSNSDLPQLYSIENDRKLCINALEPLLPNSATTVPVYIDQVVNGEYSVEISQLENLPDITVYLEDLKSGITQNLNEMTVYEFYSEEGDDDHRFNITFSSSPSSVNDIANDIMNVSVYGGNNVVNIYSKGEASEHEGRLMLYNLNGQLIKEEYISSGKLITIPVVTNERILIARLHKQGLVLVEKVVIK
jgi:hypothetical protein